MIKGERRYRKESIKEARRCRVKRKQGAENRVIKGDRRYRKESKKEERSYRVEITRGRVESDKGGKEIQKRE